MKHFGSASTLDEYARKLRRRRTAPGGGVSQAYQDGGGLGGGAPNVLVGGRALSDPKGERHSACLH